MPAIRAALKSREARSRSAEPRQHLETRPLDRPSESSPPCIQPQSVHLGARSRALRSILGLKAPRQPQSHFLDRSAKTFSGCWLLVAECGVPRSDLLRHRDRSS
jgi:hypothetical protein